MELSITNYTAAHRHDIRRILENIGWAEQYIAAAERNTEIFSRDQNKCAYVAINGDEVIGFIYVQFHEWNRLAQIEGLAVDPGVQRQGAASKLVARGEEFAREKGARGMYVDTPTVNQKGRGFYEGIGYKFGYEMPRYYEDELDGVTYQKFFEKEAR